MHKCRRLEIASRFYIIVVEFYEVNATGKCSVRILMQAGLFDPSVGWSTHQMVANNERLVIYKKCYITLTVVWIYTIHVCCTKYISIVAKRSIRFFKKSYRKKEMMEKNEERWWVHGLFFGTRAGWFKIRAQKVFMSSKKNIVNNILRLFQ